MFEGCTSLVSSNLNNIITSIIKNMDRLFYNCNSLISLHLSNLNTSFVGVMLNILLVVVY